jgi:hypothetical protein
VCEATGLVRYGERKDARLAIRAAQDAHWRAALDGVRTGRPEISVAKCVEGCGGFHCTYQPARITYTVCEVTGKRRYAERKDALIALQAVQDTRWRAALRGEQCNRREINSYTCRHCDGGYHLTSQPLRPTRIHIPAPRTSPEAGTVQAGSVQASAAMALIARAAARTVTYPIPAIARAS